MLQPTVCCMDVLMRKNPLSLVDVCTQRIPTKLTIDTGHPEYETSLIDTEKQTEQIYLKRTKMKPRSLFLLLPFVTTCLACTSFPSDLTGDWTDSSTNKGVDFTSSGVTGWDVTLFGRSVNSWSCVDEDTDQILLASSPVKIYGLDFVVYRCMKYKKLSNCSYKITFNSGKEMNAGNQRVFVLLKGDKDANGDSKATVALCNAGVVESRTIRKNTCS